jgi:hypothetical protein
MCQHCEHAMCPQTIDPMFNLHIYNLVEIAIKILDDIVPNQQVRFIHELRTIENMCLTILVCGLQLKL